MKTIILSFLFCFAANAIVIDDYSQPIHDRFANSESFILPYNLSGVARSDDGKWATLIAHDVFLSATHYKPRVGSTIYFYEDNDPMTIPVTRNVISLSRIGRTDITVGFLDHPVPETFATYSFAEQKLDTHGGVGFQDSDYYLREVFMFGRSPSSWPNSQNMAVGKNKLASYNTGGTSGFHYGIESFVEIKGHGGNYVEYESNVRSGDSGSPMFVEKDGELELVGLGWYTSVGFVNGHSYLGNYHDEIQDKIPEPHMLVVMAFFIGVLILRRNRLFV